MFFVFYHILSYILYILLCFIKLYYIVSKYFIVYCTL